jgi:hypothetical protein
MTHKSTLPPVPHIDDVKPVSSNDEACLGDIRAVLQRHGALQRFGVMLLHEHFDLAPDEVLVETVDPSTRTLTIRPAKKAEVDNEPSLPTSWRLDSPDALLECRTQCIPAGDAHGHAHMHL